MCNQKIATSVTADWTKTVKFQNLSRRKSRSQIPRRRRSSRSQLNQPKQKPQEESVAEAEARRRTETEEETRRTEEHWNRDDEQEIGETTKRRAIGSEGRDRVRDESDEEENSTTEERQRRATSCVAAQSMNEDDGGIW
nr:uncharacterized protein LOC112704923 [Arachis hypogaea]